MTTWLDTQEIADKKGVSVGTAKRWCVSGKLPAKKEDGRWYARSDAVDKLEVAPQAVRPDRVELSYTPRRRLQMARKRQGTTIAIIADKIGCERTQLSNYENGHRQPPLTILKKWANFLGFNCNDKGKITGPDGD